MKIQVEATETYITFEDGQKFIITVAYRPVTDMLSIGWCKMVKDFDFENFSPPVYEDISTVTNDSAPGCIVNTVYLLEHEETRAVRGIQMSPILNFPLSPTGKTLMGYISILSGFPGFEETTKLVRSIGMGEEFIENIRLDVTVPKRK